MGDSGGREATENMPPPGQGDTGAMDHERPAGLHGDVSGRLTAEQMAQLAQADPVHTEPLPVRVLPEPPMLPIKWVHCSPEFCSAHPNSCGDWPRRACQCGPDYGSHDHAVTDWPT